MSGISKAILCLAPTYIHRYFQQYMSTLSQTSKQTNRDLVQFWANVAGIDYFKVSNDALGVLC